MSALHFQLHEHDEVDSTNARALAALDAGEAKHGDVHVANAQSEGRGRRGASWWSPAGEGVYLSVVLAPESPYWSPGLTMATGLAAMDAFRAHGLLPGRGLRVDWPNDVVFGEAKLGGILVEARDPGEGARYVVGVGLNVRQTEFPPELTGEREVASLASLGREAEVASVRDAFLERLAARLETLVADPAGLGYQYVVALQLEGRHVRATAGEETLEGVMLGIGPEGGLRLQVDEGEAERPLEHVTALKEIKGRTDRLGRR